jgi:hypothetical protein
MNRTFNYTGRVLLVVGLLLAPTIFDMPLAANGNANPRILPPQVKPYGKTYGAWGAEWWKWVVGIPAAENPILDETGEFGAIDQAGPVWFLAGNSGGTTERTLVVPTGKALFFPILTQFWGCPSPEERAFLEEVARAYLGMDPAAVAALTDVDLMRLVIGAQMDSVISLSATIDGVAVQDLKQYRAKSPVFTFEDLDSFGVEGECSPAVADGYWLMVAPLPVGEHTIHFSGVIADAPLDPLELDVTYHLIVR